MQKMTILETKETIAGALSGSLLTGVASIIDSITNFITGMAGLTYVFSGADGLHSQGDFKFGKNLSFDWDDTKGKATNVIKLDLNSHHQDSQFTNHAYDLT